MSEFKKGLSNKRLYSLLDECLFWIDEVVSDKSEFISVLRGCGFTDEEMRILGIGYENIEEEDCIENYLK